MDNAEILITQLKINVRTYKEQLDKSNREIQSLKQRLDQMASEIVGLKSKDSQIIAAISGLETILGNIADKINA